MEGFLKNKKYCYKLANSKLIRGKELVKFVEEFFGGHMPSKEEWHDFFVDLMKEYSKMGEDFIPPIDIIKFIKNEEFQSMADVPELAAACYLADYNKILISEETIEKIEQGIFAFFVAVNSLMHEYRHFYQFESEKNQENKELIDCMGKNYNEVIKSLKATCLINSQEIESVCTAIHKVTSKCGLVEQLFILDDEERQYVFTQIAYASYLNVPYEKDARQDATKKTDDFYRNVLDNVQDEKLKNKMEEDYRLYYKLSNFQDPRVEFGLNDLYKVFLSDLSKLNVKDLDKICVVLDKTGDQFLFARMLYMIYGLKSSYSQLELCLKCIAGECYNVFEWGMNLFDFGKEQIEACRNAIVLFSKDKPIKEEVLENLLSRGGFLEERDIKDMFFNFFGNKDYSQALMCFKQLNSTKLDNDFLNKIRLFIKNKILVLKYNVKYLCREDAYELRDFVSSLAKLCPSERDALYKYEQEISTLINEQNENC